jgi:benzoate-CoA ligase
MNGGGEEIPTGRSVGPVVYVNVPPHDRGTDADHGERQHLVDANLEAGRAESTALITAEDEPWSYAALQSAMCRVAAHLAEAGVRREERVLLVLDDTPAFPAAFLGALRIGAVPIPVNFLARPDDFGYFLDDSYAVAAIVDAAFLGTVGPQLERRAHVRRIVANGREEGYVPLDGWLEEGPDAVAAVETHRDDPAFWLYSSGSTGAPKAVVHRHADIGATCRHYARPVLGIGAGDVVFSSTKMFHAYGLGNNLTFPLSVGATSVYLAGRPTPDRLLERVATHRPSLYFSVPALYNAVLAHSGSTRPTGRPCGSACRPPNRLRRRSGDVSTREPGSRSSTASAPPRCSTSTAPTVRGR